MTASYAPSSNDVDDPYTPLNKRPIVINNAAIPGIYSQKEKESPSPGPSVGRSDDDNETGSSILSGGGDLDRFFEDDEVENKEKPTSMTFLLWVVVAFSAITGLLMGFDLSVVAVVLDPIQQEFGLCPVNQVSCFKRELFVSVIGPGAIAGSFIGGYSADKFGRRFSLAISDVLFIFGSVAFVLSKTFAHLLVARALIGAGVGVGFVVFATYVSEVSPAHLRGRLVVSQEVAQCCGVFVTYLAASVIGDTHWKSFLVAGGLVAFVQLLGILVLPESPRWMMARGDIENSAMIMRKLGMDAEVILASVRLNESLAVAGGVPTHAGTPAPESFCAAIWDARASLLVASFVGVAQNALCTNAILYFSADIFKMGGICQPYEWGMGLGVMKLIGTCVVVLLVDKLGRRKLLLIGTVGLCLAFSELAITFGAMSVGNDVAAAQAVCRAGAGTFAPPAGLSRPGAIPTLVGLFSLVLAWELSWAGLMYVVASEILPSRVRGAGMGLVVFCFWTSLSISQLVFEPMFGILSISGTFVGLAVMAVIVAVLTYLYVPDMTGRSLEAITRYMSETNWAVVSRQASSRKSRSVLSVSSKAANSIRDESPPLY